MASSGSRAKSRSFRFRGTKFAKKRLIWTSVSGSFTEVAGTPQHLIMCLPTQWETNGSSGDFQTAKVLRCMLHLTAVPISTAQARLYTMSIDDSAQVSLDPSVQASYNEFDPFHTGVFYVGGNVAAQPTVPVFNGYIDGVRNVKANRKVRSDQFVNVFIQPASGAGSQLTFTYLARVLVQLG